jgi:aryl-alcohol dehydrogenase (NADP+)
VKYCTLGRSGLEVSRLAFGCMGLGVPWGPDPAQSHQYLIQAFDAGVNFFDTSNNYGRGRSETILGAALREIGRRDAVVIATKVGMPMSDGPNGRGLGRKHILANVDASLMRLQTDYIDLYQIHRLDPLTPIEETLDALDTVVKAGKVRYLGASSMFAWQFMKILALCERHGLARFVSMQNHYNLIYREEEREMMPLCLSEGIGVVPWGPLAKGRLVRTGVTARGASDTEGDLWYPASPARDAIILAVRTIAQQRGVSMAAVALAWLLGRPGVAAPIVGVSKQNHIDDALVAVDLELTAAEIEMLESPYRTLPVVGISVPGKTR